MKNIFNKFTHQIKAVAFVNPLVPKPILYNSKTHKYNTMKANFKDLILKPAEILDEPNFFSWTLGHFLKLMAYVLIAYVALAIINDLFVADQNYFTSLDNKKVGSFQVLRSVIASLFSLAAIIAAMIFIFKRLSSKANYLKNEPDTPLYKTLILSFKLLGELLVVVPLATGVLYFITMVFKAFIFVPSFFKNEMFDIAMIGNFPLLGGLRSIASVEIPDVLQKNWKFMDYILNVAEGGWVLATQVISALIILLYVYFIAEVISFLYIFLKEKAAKID